MSDDRLLDATNLAAKAQQLLNDETLIMAYEGIEANLVSAWIASEPRDQDGREMCWRMIHANRKHRDALQMFVSNGKLAQAELDRLKT